MLGYFFAICLSTQYYKCQEDYCVCCFERFELGMYTKIQKFARLIHDFSHTGIDPNKTLILNKKLKQIENMKHMFYRTCSNPNSFHAYQLQIPVTWLQTRTFLKANCNDGIQKCLRTFCRNNTGRSTVSFSCLDENIRNLDTEYENQQCFSKIRYMNIESSNLVKIANGGFLANNRVDWNIVYLKLDFATDIPIAISCDAFQYLNKLRTLKLNIFQVINFRCFFRFNPDIVKIEWENIRIWNMCNGVLDIWVNGVHHNEKNGENHTIWELTTYVETTNYIIIVFLLMAMVLTIYMVIKKWNLVLQLVFPRSSINTQSNSDDVGL